MLPVRETLHRRLTPQRTLFWLPHDPDAAPVIWPSTANRSSTRATSSRRITLHTKEKEPTYPQQSSLFLMTLLLITMALIAPGWAIADDVTDWNQYMFQAALIEKTSPVVMTRVAAIVQASVFDAVNGVERRYTPIHVKPTGPRRASRRAAAVQAAYATLIKLYPN